MNSHKFTDIMCFSHYLVEMCFFLISSFKVTAKESQQKKNQTSKGYDEKKIKQNLTKKMCRANEIDDTIIHT